MKADQLKVAFVYDWVNQWGGAERLLLQMKKVFPQADLFTSVYDEKKASWAKESFSRIYPSFLNRFPGAKQKYYLYFALMPYAFESFNFSGYDLVISLTSFAAKFVVTDPKTFHLCYCLTPPRWLWQKEALDWQKKLFPFNAGLRVKDFIASQRPDAYLATCENVRKRIEKYYRRQAAVVYPPVDTHLFRPAKKRKKGNYYLLVSRLVEYKRVDLAIKVFNQLGWPLKIVGRGREEKQLKAVARGNIEFLGLVDDQELVSLYQQCQAIIFPQEEDFGLVPLEAQACGRPVIAYQAGGALETIIRGKTGEFFPLQNKQSLLELLQEFKPERYKTADCRKNAVRFSQEKFLKTFKEEVEKIIK